MYKAGGVELYSETASTEEKKGLNPMSNVPLDSSSLIELGWKGYFDAEIGCKYIIRVLKEYHTWRAQVSI